MHPRRHRAPALADCRITSYNVCYTKLLRGIPPTAGFIGKFGVFHAAVKAGYLWLAVIGVAASVISVYYYLRVVIALFMSDEEAPALHPGGLHEHAALAVCLAAALILGILPGPLLDLIAAVTP